MTGNGTRWIPHTFDPTKALEGRAQSSDEKAMIPHRSSFLNPDCARGDAVDPLVTITIADPNAATTEVVLEATYYRGLKEINIFIIVKSRRPTIGRKRF